MKLIIIFSSNAKSTKQDAKYVIIAHLWIKN